MSMLGNNTFNGIVNNAAQVNSISAGDISADTIDVSSLSTDTLSVRRRILPPYIKLDETSLVPPAEAGGGWIYVKNETPNELHFLDDAGTDTQLTGKKLQVLEKISGFCDGRTVEADSGTITLPTVSAVQSIDSTTYADVNGSALSYTPPAGTTQVIYEFNFHMSKEDNYALIHVKFMLEDDTPTYQELTKARSTLGVSVSLYGMGQSLRYTIQIDDSLPATDAASIADGKVKTWNSPRGMKLQARYYQAGDRIDLFDLLYWDGADANNTLVLPTLTITAIGTR